MMDLIKLKTCSEPFFDKVSFFSIFSPFLYSLACRLPRRLLLFQEVQVAML